MRKFFMAMIIASCVLAVSAAAAGAATRYATPTGTAGSGSGCLIGNPCSLLAAVDSDELDPGDTISLSEGDFEFDTAISIGAANVTLTGAGADKTRLVFTGASTYPLTLADATVLASDLSINTSHAGPSVRISAGKIERVAASNASVDSGATACQAIGSIGEAAIVNSICSRPNAGNGVGLLAAYGSSGASSIVIRNSTLIAGENGAGLYASPSATPTSIAISNTIISGGTFDVATQYNSADSELTISADHSNYSNVYNGLSSTDIPAPGTATNQTAEPVFAESNFYTQAASSPTIDAGQTYVGVGLKDLLGAQRTQGAAIDIGATEFTSPIVNPPVDTTKPTVTITKRPKSGTSKKARVSFKANEPATFECKLDKARTWKRCTSPWKKTVKVGKHKLRIRATDTAGNVGAAKWVSWTVKKKRR